MSDGGQAMLIVFGIIAGLFTVVCIPSWWIGRYRDRLYWRQYGPALCPLCGGKYAAGSDVGQLELDLPVQFSGHVFECIDCGGRSCFESVSKGKVHFVGRLIDGNSGCDPYIEEADHEIPPTHLA